MRDAGIDYEANRDREIERGGMRVAWVALWVCVFAFVGALWIVSYATGSPTAWAWFKTSARVLGVAILFGAVITIVEYFRDRTALPFFEEDGGARPWWK